MKDRFDLIIFDWDGTLVDSVDWIVHCLTIAAGKQGCDIPSEQAIKDITQNKNIRAVVLRVDSPGGGVTASDEIWHFLQKIKELYPLALQSHPIKVRNNTVTVE